MDAVVSRTLTAARAAKLDVPRVECFLPRSQTSQGRPVPFRPRIGVSCSV